MRRFEEVVLVRAAMREGALGLSSSQLDIHVAHDGREVPSNHAAPDELVALAGVLAEFEHGALEFIPRSFLNGYDDADRELMRAMARAAGRPMELNTLVRLPNAPDGWRRSLEFARDACRDGLRIHPMFATNKLGAHFALDSTFLFDEVRALRDVLVLPPAGRERQLRDPAVRAAIKEELADRRGRAFAVSWEIVQVEAVNPPEHTAWVGRTVAELARERSQDPVDCFLDLSLVEALATQFVLDLPPDPAGEAALRVPGTLSLEAAVSRLTMMPAVIHGLVDRGLIREGMWADLVLFEPRRLRAGAARLVRDFPAGSARYVVDAEGYVATIVNGEPLLENGRWSGATPGKVLRG